MDLATLKEKIWACYEKELCYPKNRAYWSLENPSYGMCAITALIVNDYFGGEIAKIYVDNDSHYFNLIDDQIVDLTSEQFGHEIDYAGYTIVKRQDILIDDTSKRYKILKDRLEKTLEPNINKGNR